MVCHIVEVDGCSALAKEEDTLHSYLNELCLLG